MNSCHEEDVHTGIELESKLPIPREARDLSPRDMSSPETGPYYGEIDRIVSESDE
eukprot:gene26825-biopygen17414